ncbi:MAG: hypothetical protein ACREP9_22575, partial [Candidatus Dormibacteraceae bacterium]
LGNFYWTSSPEAQHSRNIEADGEVFLVVYDSTVPEGTGEGVYIEAIAGVLDDLDEIAEARRHSGLRRGKYDPQERPEQYLPGGVCRVYRARPKRAWMNDDVIDENGCFVKDIRVEIPLTSLTGLVYW